MPYSKTHKLQSKDRILKSATELFSRYGFDKVSISQIMKLARMTHGAFYAHFESKEALYNASFFETLKRSRAARLVKGPFSIKHLTTFVTDYLNLRDPKRHQEPGPEAILFNEIGSDNDEIQRLYEKSYLGLKEMLETRITALSKLNKLPFKADKETVAEKSRAIIASMVGAMAIAKSIPHEEEQRNILLTAQKQIFTILGVSENDLHDLSDQSQEYRTS
ncbi:MAG: TetR/AcrR family transcriptional regulator [Candidatus Thiodiazotropha sp. (ex Monitilora ramsayi)]|nr:TetR/AcrR family transcriptional regulator [Candidatus Thiodiazotropha sp. (ex Monitilora ramsayi)]